MAAIPTWPPADTKQQEVVDYWNTTPQEEDLYLRLSQVLQCEIWRHKQTRAELFAEQCRREDLEGVIQQQAQTIADWQDACQTAYTSIEGHRTLNENVKREMEAVAAEVARLKRETPSDPFVGADATRGVAEMAEAGFVEASPEPVGENGGAVSDDRDEDVEQWQLDFIREIEEHLELSHQGGTEH